MADLHPTVQPIQDLLDEFWGDAEVQFNSENAAEVRRAARQKEKLDKAMEQLQHINTMIVNSTSMYGDK